MDSTEQRAPVGSEIINENRVAAYSEIINKIASTGDAWIRQRKEPLWTKKSSTKLLTRVTHGFNSANSPSGLRNNHRKQSRCRLRNPQQNCCHGWCMDSTAQKTQVASEIINETASTGDAWIRHRNEPLLTQKSSTKLLPMVTHGFDSANSPCGLRNNQWKLSWCRLRNPQWNCFHGWRIDSTTQKAPVASEIINETASNGDAWIWQRQQPLWTQK